MIGLKIAGIGFLCWVVFAIASPPDTPANRKAVSFWLLNIPCTLGMWAIPVGLVIWIVSL